MSTWPKPAPGGDPDSKRNCGLFISGHMNISLAQHAYCCHLPLPLWQWDVPLPLQ